MVSLEEAINERKSTRTFKPASLELNEISQLLWAGAEAPSAGAIYPMEIYLVAGDVNELEAGVYKYNPKRHSLDKTLQGDKRNDLWKACLNQSSVLKAPASFVVTAIYEKIKAGYGERGVRYAIIEAGHISQNIYLQAEALGLGTVAIGAFFDDNVAGTLEVPARETPLYVMPVGKR